jgi:hypothetical protein
MQAIRQGKFEAERLQHFHQHLPWSVDPVLNRGVVLEALTGVQLPCMILVQANALFECRARATCTYGSVTVQSD